MSESAGSKRFGGIIPVLAALVVFILFVSLGRWQLNRADEKERLFEGFDIATESVVQRGPVNDEAARRDRFARLAVYGSYDDRQFLLDNMVSNGRVGYQVLTPLRLPGEARLLLVNRGWIPINPDRRILPRPDVDLEDREVTGRIGRLPVAGFRAGPGLLGDETGWPRRAQFPTREELEAELGSAVFDYVLLLDPDQPDGYLREWRPTVMNPDRHRAYSLQWFAMAATVVILFLVLFIRNRGRRPNE